MKVSVGNEVIHQKSGQIGKIIDMDHDYLYCHFNNVKYTFKIYKINDNLYNIDSYKNISIIQLTYAMTIHKSIPYQWEHVMLYLPITKTNFINLQMVHTAKLRAKKTMMMIEEETGIYENALNNKVEYEMYGIGYFLL